MRIDLNCDVGEGIGDEEALLAIVTSANVSCGAHAGDEYVISSTIATARRHNVAVGAHPSYPDREGFGRRGLRVSPAEVEAFIAEQLAYLAGLAQVHGVRLRHVKPHGALYNDAASNRQLADAVARAVTRFDGKLILIGLAGSAMIDAAKAAGLAAAAEAFCDRTYEPDGSLRLRALPGALVTEAAAAARQALDIVLRKRATAYDGAPLTIEAQTLCIHGDTPGAVRIAQTVREALTQAGVEVRPVEVQG